MKKVSYAILFFGLILLIILASIFNKELVNYANLFHEAPTDELWKSYVNAEWKMYLTISIGFMILIYVYFFCDTFKRELKHIIAYLIMGLLFIIHIIIFLSLYLAGVDYNMFIPISGIFSGAILVSVLYILKKKNI